MIRVTILILLACIYSTVTFSQNADSLQYYRFMLIYGDRKEKKASKLYFKTKTPLGITTTHTKNKGLSKGLQKTGIIIMCVGLPYLIFAASPRNRNNNFIKYSSLGLLGIGGSITFGGLLTAQKP